MVLCFGQGLLSWTMATAGTLVCSGSPFLSPLRVEDEVSRSQRRHALRDETGV